METFWITYLMIGFYFAFMVYYELEEEGVTGDHILNVLPIKLSNWLLEHQNMYVLLLVTAAVFITVAWPYVLYLMWRNRNEEY